MKRFLIVVIAIAVFLEVCMSVRSQTNSYASSAITSSSTGWTEDSEETIWTYVSENSAGNTFVISTTGDLTDTYYASLRFRAKQGGAYEYFIVHLVEYSAGVTELTLFGGTDGTLTDTTITDTAFSPVRFPKGFPISEDSWAIEHRDSTYNTQTTPSAVTWYNVGSLSLSIPVGLWNVKYRVSASIQDTSGTSLTIYATLSTANNSESDSNFTSYFGINGASGNLILAAWFSEEKIISLSQETTYYLNVQTLNSTVEEISLGKTGVPRIIRAVSEYY